MSSLCNMWKRSYRSPLYVFSMDIATSSIWWPQRIMRGMRWTSWNLWRWTSTGVLCGWRASMECKAWQMLRLVHVGYSSQAELMGRVHPIRCLNGLWWQESATMRKTFEIMIKEGPGKQYELNSKPWNPDQWYGWIKNFTPQSPDGRHSPSIRLCPKKGHDNLVLDPHNHRTASASMCYFVSHLWLTSFLNRGLIWR